MYILQITSINYNDIIFEFKIPNRNIDYISKLIIDIYYNLDEHDDVLSMVDVDQFMSHIKHNNIGFIGRQLQTDNYHIILSER